MRKWIWISLASLAVVAAGATMGAKPFVRSRILGQAEARGLELRMGALRLGYPTITLEDVRVSPRGLPGVRVDLRELDVTVGLIGPLLRGLEVRGGTLRLEGSAERLLEDLSSFRSEHFSSRAAESTGAPTSGRREIARDLRLLWDLGDGRTLDVSGLQYERLPGKPRRVGADLLQVSASDSSISVAGSLVEFSPDGGSLARVSVAEARLLWKVGNPRSPPAHGGLNPDPNEEEEVPATSDPSERQERGLLGLFEVHPTRPAALRALLSGLRRQLVPKLPSKTGIDRLYVEVSSGADRISVGPSALSVEKRAEEVHLNLSPGEQAQGTPLELQVRLPLTSSGSLTASVAGGPVSLSSLGAREGDFGLKNVSQAFLGVEAEVQLSPDAERVAAEGVAFIDSLALLQPKLAEGTIYVPRLSVRGTIGARVDGASYRLADAEIRLSTSRFEGGFSVERKAEKDGERPLVLDAKLSAPLVSCQQLSDSAPRALLGPVADLRYAGTFSLGIHLQADTSQLAKMKVDVDFQNGCKITRVPVDLDPMQFRGPFTREVLGPGGLPMNLQFGPGSDDWVSIEQITPFMEAAVLVTEDGRFFRHSGFDVSAIESAIRDNTRSGRFVRGASTISMQLAKNLFLSRDKRLSRKFQEAALTMLLEQSFEKRELLELYLNVIEFGPGVYGIGPAAAHYFRTVPSQLSAAQAFFLASILPAPGVTYFDEEGNLSAARTKQVRYLLGVSHERGRLTDQQLEAALSEELKLGVPAQTDREEVEDRGVHAVPSEEGRPLAFPGDEEERRSGKEGPASAPERPRRRPTRSSGEEGTSP